jgi:putative CRISPR-associated protein (TIGR02619 family)
MPIKKEEIVKAYTTLIATVGASLYGNLSKLPDCKTEFDNGSLEPIVQRMVSRSWGDPEEAMTYGSEINSTVSLIRRFENLGEGTFNPINLYFFVSDTPIGEKIGILLKSFFERDPELRFKNVKVIKIDKLSDTDEYAFGKEGLRNLVREFARVARNHRFGLAVNATGGYKAQIALRSL